MHWFEVRNYRAPSARPLRDGVVILHDHGLGIWPTAALEASSAELATLVLRGSFVRDSSAELGRNPVFRERPLDFGVACVWRGFPCPGQDVTALPRWTETERRLSGRGIVGLKTKGSPGCFSSPRGQIGFGGRGVTIHAVEGVACVRVVVLVAMIGPRQSKTNRPPRPCFLTMMARPVRLAFVYV